MRIELVMKDWRERVAEQLEGAKGKPAKVVKRKKKPEEPPKPPKPPEPQEPEIPPPKFHPGQAVFVLTGAYPEITYAMIESAVFTCGAWAYKLSGLEGRVGESHMFLEARDIEQIMRGVPIHRYADGWCRWPYCESGL